MHDYCCKCTVIVDMMLCYYYCSGFLAVTSLSHRTVATCVCGTTLMLPSALPCFQSRFVLHVLLHFCIIYFV